MELKVNGKFVTSSKVKNHVALKIYGAPKLYTVIVLCSKMTSFPPSEGDFSEYGRFSKVNIFPNPFSHILETINKNCHKR